ncbi:hypothetical protein Vadar_000737 [Vaccinium darrowii]|uniref:Uncharacterized protein n=1 Tax=Vaccinium darrowii TaxID=229202 RepID=A0ACB7XW67_9ERIC|nr:hypothetical protein Vadar_000737 [Vaccinium darrowii]
MLIILVYQHCCKLKVVRSELNSQKEVIFPALDIRVMNMARTYSLEHEGESFHFDQLFALLNSNVQTEENSRRELASCTGALQPSISQHMSKEEEQVIFHFTSYRYSPWFSILFSPSPISLFPPIGFFSLVDPVSFGLKS